MQDKYTIFHALSLWKNYIETGDVTMDRQTAKKIGGNINNLNDGQIEFVNEIKKLANDILSNKKVIINKVK